MVCNYGAKTRGNEKMIKKIVDHIRRNFVEANILTDVFFPALSGRIDFITYTSGVPLVFEIRTVVESENCYVYKITHDGSYSPHVKTIAEETEKAACKSIARYILLIQLMREKDKILNAIEYNY